MGDLAAASDSISPMVAILWVFYPMATLVLIELLLRLSVMTTMMIPMVVKE